MAWYFRAPDTGTVNFLDSHARPRVLGNQYQIWKYIDTKLKETKVTSQLRGLIKQQIICVSGLTPNFQNTGYPRAHVECSPTTTVIWICLATEQDVTILWLHFIKKLSS